MTEPPIPDIGPTEGDPNSPLEWIETQGPIRWTTNKLKIKCEDCLQLILDHINGAQQFDRPPGLARMATWKRTQGAGETFHCGQHHQRRKAESR